ncbi:MAG TPA: STAS/SEC14 domain-containing protein [Stellaceae bacterium]|nr:STAS/SEC14 domain-containing protein [Stellaceae bacterium]
MITVELLKEKGIAIVTPEGKLEASDFARIGAAIDPYILANGSLKGLMICAPAFPGWADFAALVSHIRFVRGHHRKIARIAAVTDSDFAKLVPAVAKHFVAAEIRHFAFAEKASALAWLVASR